MAKKKVTKKKVTKKKTVVAKPPTKSEVFATLAEQHELTRKQVAEIFASLDTIIQKSLKKHGVFTLPGLAKMTVVKKKATKARKGISPFTGEEIIFKAKPASKNVRIRPLKGLKEMIN
ncbi:MAG: HU family DNA-binding protein [Planctomycetota bacterium]